MHTLAFGLVTGGALITALVYFVIIVLVLYLVWIAVGKFAPQASQVVGIVLAIILLLVALQLFFGLA